jgi:predicted NAD/FAD-binding protein
MPQAGFVHSQVNEVRRGARGVRVTTEAEVSQWYDLVVLACHADQSLRLLHDPSDLERKLLSAFAYQRNDTLLHLDQSVMPRAKNCWASWNYRFDKVGATTHYWMNSLQGVSRERNYFVSLDSHHLIDRSLVLKEIVYHHPLFDLNALRAQRDLHKLNLYSRKEQVFFCGSYFGYGFHEDALASSLRLAEQLCGSVLCK